MGIGIQYEDLLSGDYVYVEGVGHIRSPKLKEMNPNSGIGWERYSYYIFFMKMGENQLSLIPNVKKEGSETLFNCILRHEPLRKLYSEAFSFFMHEYAIYDKENNCFLCVSKNENTEEISLVGKIENDNFDNVRAGILTMNYVPLSETNIQTKHSSKASEILWNQVQQHMAKQKSNAPVDEKLTIGNILSKICAIHPSINYLNVFDLTVFQFYDTFFQCCYMRQTEFSESIVSNHGSKDFKYEDWLKPVKNC